MTPSKDCPVCNKPFAKFNRVAVINEMYFVHDKESKCHVRYLYIGFDSRKAMDAFLQRVKA